MPLSLLVEALTHGDGPEDVHQHAVVWHLIEVLLLRGVVVVQLLSDELEDALHELQLAQVKRCQKAEDQLDKAINEPVVKSVVVHPLLSICSSLTELDTLLYHHFAEGIPDLFIGVNTQLS